MDSKRKDVSKSVCMCVCVFEKERACVRLCVWVKERERERESACMRQNEFEMGPRDIFQKNSSKKMKLKKGLDSDQVLSQII